MLQNLHVKNLALIDEVEVDFSDGLNILTGETGAGKSIVLGSVNLALGGRYTADMLRKDSQFGLVELTFSVNSAVQRKALEQIGVYPEEGQIIISRKLMEGRSISRINGETVTVAQIKEAAALLIDIHGQHEHQSLLYKKNHLMILDAFAKDGKDLKEKVKAAYKQFKEDQKELLSSDTDEAERLKEIAFLEFEIGEIREASLSTEEEEEIEHTYRLMVNGKKMAENLSEAHSYTAEDNGAGEAMSRAIRCLQSITELDERALSLYNQLIEVDSLLNDFNRELSDYSNSISFSEQEFYETEKRLNEINHLKSKYGNSVDEILGYCEEREARLSKLKDYDVYLEELRERTKQSEEALAQLCKELSKMRKKEAVKLEKNIVDGLLELNFLDVRFEIHFEPAKGYSVEGMDDVEFRISMNPGEPLKPLSDVASGGELSRIMLAIKTVLADKDEIETLIFDEIDVGISGRTAQKVSEKMALIGKKHQVICITHLAQIAAMADAHYVIEKTADKNVTKTSIYALDSAASIHELARILGGAQITETVLNNAREMKILASGLKK